MYMEIWKQITGLPINRKYEVSNTGKVRNSKNNNIIKTSITNSGYERIILGSKYKNKVIWRYIHRLVALAFIGSADGLDINHLDGNRLNNNLQNLEICTRRENHLHAFKKLGRKVHNIKLTKNQAEKIRYEINYSGKTQKQIAKDYSVSPMLVSRIKHFIQVEYK